MGSQDYPTSIEAQILLLNVLARATAQGWQAGCDADSYAGDCPYSNFLMPLRHAWLDGFSVGRVASKHAPER